MTRVVVRRTFDAGRMTLADFRSVAVQAHEMGLDDTSRLGIRLRWAAGWKVDVTVTGEARGNLTIRTVLDQDREEVTVDDRLVPPHV